MNCTTIIKLLKCCLSIQVRWEDGVECNGQDRVSPWEIEIAGGSVSVAHSLSASSSKRTKLCPQGNLDVPTMCKLS
jgi:auxin response factor